MDEFKQRDCAVLGISTDDIATHVRWLTTPAGSGGLGRISFPLAADPDAATCMKYGVYVERQRVALRGVFIIDPNGVLQYQLVHSLAIGRSTDELLRVLDALQSGGLCPGDRQIGEATIDVAANLQTGRVLGPYRIEDEIGSGSFGTVVRAKDTLLDRTVALKILRADGEASVDALLHEARAAAALNHPNVCAVHTVDTSNGASMIVMEFVPGRTLAEIIKSGQIPEDHAIALARQLAAGMACAHDAGVIHGDLKPGNIVVNEDGIAKIMDFGLSRRVVSAEADEDTLPHAQANTSSGLWGTLGYLAPELARGGTPTSASDAFAIGLIIYEMLAGERAITGSNVLEILHQVEEFDPAPLIAKLPQPLQAALGYTLSVRPEERLSMSQLLTQLNALATSH